LDPRFTWDIEAIFATPADWDVEYAAVEAALPSVGAHRGTLTHPASTLAFLGARDALAARLARL
ncbi:hypothetical protein, partial [Deinococcus pimensis]|uniref:hypothetical protein n=1 Tax=Deinococcus pimensis TaxID=309888 RepID=UPI0005EBDAF4